jgi:hypothetical protein
MFLLRSGANPGRVMPFANEKHTLVVGRPRTERSSAEMASPQAMARRAALGRGRKGLPTTKGQFEKLHRGRGEGTEGGEAQTICHTNRIFINLSFNKIQIP